jgi:hypothetical protein
MELRRFSAIARPVDPRFPTNRAIGALAIAVSGCEFVWRLVSGSDLLASGWAAVGLGLTVFLAWALCREIDPDRDLSAFVAAGVALVGKLLWGTPQLAVIFWLLLSVRIVNRTTGLRATMLDSVGIAALATWLAFWLWWPIGALTALAYMLDGWLEPPNMRHRVFGFLFVPITFGATAVSGAAWHHSGATWASGVVGMLLFLSFMPVLLASGEMTTLADDTKERLSASRVRAGQILLLLTGITAVFWGGAENLVMLWPLWSAVLGASAYLLIKSVVD